MRPVGTVGAVVSVTLTVVVDPLSVSVTVIVPKDVDTEIVNIACVASMIVVFVIVPAEMVIGLPLLHDVPLPTTCNVCPDCPLSNVDSTVDIDEVITDSGFGFTQSRVLVIVTVFVPYTVGLYMKVKDVALAAGVTVKGEVPGLPTLGVNIPPTPSLRIIPSPLPSKDAVCKVTVKLLDCPPTGAIEGPDTVTPTVTALVTKLMTSVG